MRAMVSAAFPKSMGVPPVEQSVPVLPLRDLPGCATLDHVFLFDNNHCCEVDNSFGFILPSFPYEIRQTPKSRQRRRGVAYPSLKARRSPLELSSPKLRWLQLPTCAMCHCHVPVSFRRVSDVCPRAWSSHMLTLRIRALAAKKYF